MEESESIEMDEILSIYSETSLAHSEITMAHSEISSVHSETTIAL